jgi:hypothetical protein
VNGRIIFLLEEPSMKTLLECLLPRIFPGWLAGNHFLCIRHEGKDDLRKSIPKKLRVWQGQNDRFIVVQDQDKANCIALKQSIVALCSEAGRPDTLVRIVCQELESWYIGDLDALSSEYGATSFRHKDSQKRYRDPDSIDKPSLILERLIPAFQKLSGARRMGVIIRPESNKSKSFSVFISGVQRVAAEMGYTMQRNSL